MKTLQMHTPNELKALAHVNFTTMLKLLREKGFAPITIRTTRTGNRAAQYYGPDAYEFAKGIGDAKAAKKADKQARKAAWAARRAAAEERRAMKGQKKEKKETPIEVIQSVQTELPFDNGPSLRELVMETNRLLQEMLDFWKK